MEHDNSTPHTWRLKMNSGPVDKSPGEPDTIALYLYLYAEDEQSRIKLSCVSQTYQTTEGSDGAVW